jgi:uracil-DNA glycosylase
MPTTTEIKNQIENCTLCNLCKKRTKIVISDGSWDSDIFFIGEAPGREEDLQGKPFVGAAGKLLTEMIESIGLSREEVFITNIVKCRPPNNRDPLPEEVKKCWPYLESQIKIVKPKLIVTLGRHSMARFLPDLKISEAHGQPKRTKGIWQEKQVYLPLYHPAFALYNPKNKETLFKDFQKIPLIIKKLNELQ